MNPIVKSLVFVAIAFWIGCKSAPITGRKQLLMVPESQEITLGMTSFDEITAQEPISQNRHYTELVNRVGQRIAAAAQRPDYQWEFRVIASPTMNAFALPGGKVAIYEGIMPVCQTEAGLAVVMSHEVAHALARHGGERMSHSYVVNGLGTALSYATQKQDALLRQRISQAYGITSQYGFVLPYSRKHESEADHMGLILMSQAGYDPNAAPEFWERFSKSHAGPQKPEFLSTHPADDRRAADLRALIPMAVDIYAKSAVQYGIGEPIAVALNHATPIPSTTSTVPAAFSELWNHQGHNH